MYRIMIEIERTDENDTTTKKWVNLLGKTLTDAVIDPTVDLALNKAGKAEFSVPASHPYYNDFKPMKTNVEIFELDESGANEHSIFYGRVSDISTDWFNQKKITCEGALAFFNDTVQRYKRYSASDTKLIDFFKNVITRHNNQMTDDSRKIYTKDEYIKLLDPEHPDDPTKNIENKKVFRLTNYETTLDVLTEMCVESEGGYLEIVREKEDDEYKSYIKWYTNIDTDLTQHAQFGLNLLSLDRTFEVDDLYTALIPLGADYDEYTAVTNPEGNPSEKGYYVKNEDDTYSQAPDISEPEEGVTYYIKGSRPTTIKSINSNKDYILNEDAVDKHGLIFKTKRWDDISDKSKLKKKAEQWLSTERFDKLAIECNVADLNPLDSNYQTLKIGCNVIINSKPHGIENLKKPITEMSYDLNTGKKEVTIGTQEQVTLTRITKEGKTKEIRLPDAKNDPGASDQD